MSAKEDANSAKKAKTEVDIKAMTNKEYLDQFVVPHLMKALTAVSTERPKDPVKFLSDYLLKNKPTSDSSWEKKGKRTIESSHNSCQ